MLGSLKKPFSVIGISETWLTDCTAELVNITGYNFVSNHRKSKTGGGVGIYLQNDLQYKLLNECKLSDPETIESLFVKITFPHGKNIIVGSVYMAYNNFIDEYSRVYNACFPLKVIKGNLLNNCSSPWITPGLLKSINKKNRLYKKFITSPSLSNERKYKAYKNKLNHLIRIAKRKYYDTKFESAKNDLRTTWKLLNEVFS